MKPEIKAAIVTFSKNVNYGGALQEFALYTVLKDRYDTVCLDYNDPMIRANSSVVRHGLLTGFAMVLKLLLYRATRKSGAGNSGNHKSSDGLPRSLWQSLKAYCTEGFNQAVLIAGDTLNFSARKCLIQNFNNFWKQYVKYTPPYTQDALNKGACGDMDIFIAGSDQIWNPIKFGLSPVYFLTFVKPGVRKISYASSFGNFHFRDSSISEKIKGYLSDFSWISVREDHSVRELKEVCGIDARYELDPTLLLGKDKWTEALGCVPEEKDGPYLLVYLLGNYKQNIAYAKKIAHRLELPIRVLNDRPLSDFFIHNRARCTYYPSEGPDTFVGLFARASFVVTDSFHGAAFSVNFNIPFISIESRVPERVISLLKPMNLLDRIVAVKADNAEVIPLEVDFTQANEVLARERERSLSDLFEAADLKSR